MVKTPEKKEERKQNAKRKHHNSPLMNNPTDLEDTEAKKMKSKRRTPRIKIAESSTKLGKNTIVDDDEEEQEETELKKMRSKRRKSRTPQSQIEEKSRIGYSIDGKKLSRLPPIEKIRDIIGDCSDPFEQKLIKTDVDKITLNRDYVINGIIPLLTDDEKFVLDLGEIQVKTYDEFGNCYDMIFRLYNDYFYKLYNGWEKLFEDHKLNENGDCYVTVWMFRHEKTGGLCFAVIMKR